MIKSQIGPAGERVLTVPHGASALPPVTKRDLEQAWEVAREAALAPGGRRGDAPEIEIRFTELDLRLNDADAASWAGAIDKIADLTTAHGISVCLRLLALVELMGRAAWARAWFTLERAGLTFHPGLLQAGRFTIDGDRRFRRNRVTGFAAGCCGGLGVGA